MGHRAGRLMGRSVRGLGVNVHIGGMVCTIWDAAWERFVDGFGELYKIWAKLYNFAVE